MTIAKAFGVPIEQVRDTASRHGEAMAVSEAVVLGPLANDERIDPAHLAAFIKWRAIHQLWAIVDADVDRFGAMLSEARGLAREGLL